MRCLANHAGVGKDCLNRCSKPTFYLGLDPWFGRVTAFTAGDDNYVQRNDTSLDAAVDSEAHTLCEDTVYSAAVWKFDGDRQKMFLLGNTLTPLGATAESLCFRGFNIVLDCPAKPFIFRV